MTAFLIVIVSLYILLASIVAETARKNGRYPLQWFLAALAINPLIAQALLYSRRAGPAAERSFAESAEIHITVAVRQER